MKIGDKVKRPILSANTINRSNKSFVRVVDRYQKWNESITADEPRETYEKDIFECLFEPNLDGYNLAEHLKSKVYIEPDAALVEILDDIFFVRKALEDDMIAQWVKENFLTIPEDVIGKKVNCKVGFKTFNGYYITSIEQNRHRVVISESPEKKNHGYYVNYETLEFV
jgi:hypothetical protein